MIENGHLLKMPIKFKQNDVHKTNEHVHIHVPYKNPKLLQVY